MRGSRALVTIPKIESLMFPLGLHELCMVEDIEKFEADVESEVLFNGGSLQYTEIGIVESGAVEESPVGGSKCP